MSKKYMPEFYSRYKLLNIKNHEPYSSLLEMNVLYLDQTELATKEDKENKLDYWAKLFKATTWEELKAIVKNNPCMEEVAKIMYSSNIIPQEQTILEAEERARFIQRGIYEHGYEEGKRESADLLEIKDKKIEELNKQIAVLKKQLNE